MDLNTILAETDISKQIEQLKLRPTVLPAIEKIKNQYDPMLHDVNKTASRPDKRVKYSSGDKTEERTEYVARIALDMQKYIVGKSVSFCFGNPVEITYNAKTPEEKLITELIDEIMHDVKIHSHDRKVGRTLFTATEVAECWFTVESKDPGYPIDASKKIKVMLFSPMDGDTLYPLFNEYGDLIAFSREYERTEFGKTTTYFETYTDAEVLRYENEGGKKWNPSEGYPKKHDFGKIPVIYGSQAKSEWQDVQQMIDRLEKLLSNFADTNDYHASPTIVTKGVVAGFASKGEQGKIIQIDGDGDARYMSWDRAPESVKLEIETLLNLIHMFTQTSNLSFESVKGIGAVSGIALRLLFTDAHLKVKDKQEVLDEYLQRRMNLLKTIIASEFPKQRLAVSKLRITTKIRPWMIDDAESLVKMLVDATAGKAVTSQKTAVKLAGLSSDSETEYAEILKEEQQAASFESQNPTV